jgi:hypothetical protein
VGNSLGVIYDLASPVKTPVGLTISSTSKLYVASLNTAKVEVYGIDDYVSMGVTPRALYFQADVGSVSTDRQDINITNNGTQLLSWTASTADSWIDLSHTGGSLNSAETEMLSVGVDLTGLSVGTYGGIIEIMSGSGEMEVVDVTLDVVEAPLPELSVNPSSLAFASINGSNPPLQVLSIDNIGAGTLNWTATSDMPWIQMNKNTGSAPDSINVTVDPASLSEGTHSGNITIDAGNALGSPLDIPVTLEVIIQTGSINVTTNIAQAVFTIAGPAAYLGSGTSWSIQNAPVGTYLIIYSDVPGYNTPASEARILPDNSSVSFNGVYVPNAGSISVTTDNPDATFTIEGPASYSGSGTEWLVADAPVGTYVITFGGVSGYVTPGEQTKTLQTGSSLAFTAQYVTTNKNIITGYGLGQPNIGVVKAFNADGTRSVLETNAQWYDYGVNITAGDINGDGFDEIITAPGIDPTAPAEIKVFDRDGNEFHNLNMYAFDYETYLYGATVASADFNGDGYYDVIAGTGAGKNNPAYVKIYVYDPAEQKLVDSGIDLFPYDMNYGVNVAAGDVDGDGLPELITAPGPSNQNTGKIMMWDIDVSQGTGQWTAVLIREFTVQSEYGYSVTIASGDVNGDGFDEIITGDGPHNKARDVIRVYDEHGELLNVWQAGTAFNGYGANVASGDLDSDGIDDIIVTPGPGADNQAHVKVFDINGTVKADFYPFNTQYGATIAVGYLGRE